MGALGDFFGYLFATCPTFDSAARTGMRISLGVRVCRNGRWEDRGTHVTEPSKLKSLLMHNWPDKTVVRVTYKGTEIERATY